MSTITTGHCLWLTAPRMEALWLPDGTLRTFFSMVTLGVRQVSRRDIGNYAHGLVTRDSGFCRTWSFWARVIPVSSQRGSRLPHLSFTLRLPACMDSCQDSGEHGAWRCPVHITCFCPVSLRWVRPWGACYCLKSRNVYLHLGRCLPTPDEYCTVTQI